MPASMHPAHQRDVGVHSGAPHLMHSPESARRFHSARHAWW